MCNTETICLTIPSLIIICICFKYFVLKLLTAQQTGHGLRDNLIKIDILTRARTARKRKKLYIYLNKNEYAGGKTKISEKGQVIQFNSPGQEAKASTRTTIPSFAISFATAPAALANCPPLPPRKKIKERIKY